jgi:L-asparagine transporter-like permease
LSTELKRALHMRHLIMLSVGGTIASGFFLASGAAIAVAGPAVVITYALAGVITLIVMGCLAEISVIRPVAGSFATYAHELMGRWMGFMTGWNYWLAWVMGAASESIAAGTFLHALYPMIPIWLVAFVFVVFEGVINILGVLTMGEYEFVISSLKLLGLAVFIVASALAIFGVTTPHGLGFGHYTAHGGFLPYGWGGVFSSLLAVFFAYVGIELVGVTAEESVHPERDVPRALIWTAVIVTALFILASLGLLAVLPWREAGTSSSPFVLALRVLHTSPEAVAIFNFVIVLASLSSIDGGLYTASRMLFSLSRDGFFPRAWAATHPTRKTPVLAIVLTSIIILVGGVMAILAPSFAYSWAFGLSTFTWMWVWFVIGLSQYLYRKRLGPEGARRLKWRMPGYPVAPFIVMVATFGAIVGQLFVPGGWVVDAGGLAWIALSTAYYLLWGRRLYDRQAAVAEA